MEHIQFHIATYACPACDYRFSLPEFRLIKLLLCPRPGCGQLIKNFIFIKAQPPRRTS